MTWFFSWSACGLEISPLILRSHLLVAIFLPIPPEATSWSNWLLSLPWRRRIVSSLMQWIFFFLSSTNYKLPLHSAPFHISLLSSYQHIDLYFFYQVSWLKSESPFIHHITSGKESNCFYVMLDLTSIKINVIYAGVYCMMLLTLSWTIICWGRLTCPECLLAASLASTRCYQYPPKSYDIKMSPDSKYPLGE